MWFLKYFLSQFNTLMERNYCIVIEMLCDVIVNKHSFKILILITGFLISCQMKSLINSIDCRRLWAKLFISLCLKYNRLMTFEANDLKRTKRSDVMDQSVKSVVRVHSAVSLGDRRQMNKLMYHGLYSHLSVMFKQP